MIAISFTAPITESFAVPLAHIGFGVTRWLGYRWALNRLYAGEARPRRETKEPDSTLSAT